MSAIGKKRTPLARFLVVERARRDWSQEDLAEAAGIGFATVARIETGATDLRDVRLRTIQDLARALDTDTARLVELAEEEGE